MSKIQARVNPDFGRRADFPACAIAARSACSRRPGNALEIMRRLERPGIVRKPDYEGAIDVVDSRGKALNKSWHFWREGNRGSSKILVRYDTPAEVRGVGLLTMNQAGRNSPAEQWLYTPSIQRDRRIALQEKSQRFMGTDFTNEDMEERAIEDYEYSLMGEESSAGQPAYKIKAVYSDREIPSTPTLTCGSARISSPPSATEFYIAGKLEQDASLEMTGSRCRISGRRISWK